MHFLRHILNRNGDCTNSEKVKVIKETSLPVNQNILKRFLKIAEVYRCFIYAFAKISASLFGAASLKTKLQWTRETDTAFLNLMEQRHCHQFFHFRILKDRLSSNPMFPQRHGEWWCRRENKTEMITWSSLKAEKWQFPSATILLASD